MKKGSIIAWAIIVVIVVIGIIYVVGNEKATAPTIPATADTTQIPADTTNQTPPTSVSTGVQHSTTAVVTTTTVINPPVTTPVVKPTLATASSKFGTILVATNGMTLYYFGKDTPGISTCTGGCATAWPPYTVSVSAKAHLAGSAEVPGMISTLTRADGTSQVTYKGMPLYFWENDTKAGDTTGNNINSFFVAKP